MSKTSGAKTVSRKSNPTRKTAGARAVAAGRDAGAAQALHAELADKLQHLQLAVRLKRLRRESVPASDVVVVRPPENSAPDSSELRTVFAIGQENADSFLHEEGVRLSHAMPRLSVLRRLQDSLVLRANGAALRAVRHASPGLKIFPATYAYPQYIRPLGDELQEAEIQVAPGAKVKKFSVRLRDVRNAPIPNIKIRALVDWDGAHISAVSDEKGMASFHLPVIYPEIAVLLVEPDHTYWSAYRAGFKRVEAPKVTDIQLQNLVPDDFQLLKHYAPYDGQAGQGVTVGVIDTGVGPHRDLAVAGGACLVTGEEAGDFLDNGIGHGTHVAGVIAARLSEGGVYGLAPACRLLAYRVCPKKGQTGRARSTDIAAAIERAIADGCDLINISMGSVEAMPEVPDMLERARNAGVVVFAATGNDGQQLLRYPARYSHTLAVGALGRDGTFPADSPESFQESEIRRHKEFVAEFSNYGLGTDFIGPGVAVLSTYPADRFAMMSGTSMATPFTTGMAARLLSRDPQLLTMARTAARTDAIVRKLSESTRQPGWADIYSGFGVLK